MNIAMDIRVLATMPRTGVGEYTFELLNAIFLLSPQNTYFLLSSGCKKFFMPPEWQKPNIILIHLSFSNRLLNILMFLFKWPRLTDWPRLARWPHLNKKCVPKFDVLYIPNFNFAPLDPTVKTIVMVHDISFALFPQFFSWKQRLWHWALRPKHLLQTADQIIMPSHNTRRDVIEYFGIEEKKVTTLYPGLCSEFFAPNEAEIYRVKNKYNLPDNYILFLGTLEPRKNVAAIIYAFQELHRTNALARDLKLVIAGALGWKNSEVKKMIAADKHIVSIGYIDEKDKHALYKLARVFVYPSFYEGFGLPVLEAMATGTPVITSNRSSLVEVAGTAAYLVNPDRIDELVTGLERFLFDSELHNLYKTRGLVQAQKFSWERTAREFMTNLISEPN
ncbi:MAG: hypothetical protein A2821_01445 [Candidatus Magasanikbacteria bacterium RIFCSPHIGHO2_01_FULL_41_23]|uniref:Glycosyl transferase family 1 domain-containing protein n=1 Tax=Candidatus Magasanikbacteria bacterium RIFCSPLOWO2_01_FULL_40_15 TaxID=1798686 RepID=A0A1F6N4E5_9BACT|nr:MAG: hypothetical protein A2821_01445 [Candidatus Magasanikbacteria bacterium RIFCSPHIGHO2_01_FULL_41_23]OGH66788.1 MAG: hypothetical protein A3C66_01750 [Candidatus Magasanikbacteria bacterium RIFCSPHIGHO2_02_FULL_41_35]OGH74586.1 MAG: hypothetical protein A3F22_03155 [Candidatus Magasanikbacteria bacterium RIFCSPHIGHO2_12_FULL_41_16]OGH78875.1 MAG: hypothetical protein A2983_00905 [Candidatus Magasanikbacteria bacterium RIFCSPLOWO2_01_FULL_40_15]